MFVSFWVLDFSVWLLILCLWVGLFADVYGLVGLLLWFWVLVIVLVCCWLTVSCISAVVSSRFDYGFRFMLLLIVLLWFTTRFVLVVA